MDRNDQTAQTIKADTKDALDEAKHRVKAGGEKLNRAVQGDDMPLGDRIASHVKEAGDDIKADLDKTKREVRHEARNEGI